MSMRNAAWQLVHDAYREGAARLHPADPDRELMLRLAATTLRLACSRTPAITDDMPEALEAIPVATGSHIEHLRDRHVSHATGRRLGDDFAELYDAILAAAPAVNAYWLRRSAGIASLEDLAAATDAELLAVSGIGPKRLAALRAIKGASPARDGRCR